MCTAFRIAEAQGRAADLGVMSGMRYLEGSEYSKWDELVGNSPQSSVFCRSWWLNAVGEFCILGYFEDSELIAGIPLFFERRFGVRVCTMPRLTPTLGVVIRSLAGSASKVAARQAAIVGEIARKLSEYKLFFHAMHPDLHSWLPFYEAGFRQTIRYTYVIEDLIDLGRVWDRMNDNTRRHITKAEKAGIRVVPCGIDDVYQCELESHARRGTAPRHTKEVLRRIHDAAVQHSAGACAAAVDPDGHLLSAGFVAWDRNRAYGIVSGNNRGCRESSAGFAVKWHEIRAAAQRSRVYDFCGSMMEGVGRFNRGFGARQVSFHFITKAPPPVYCALQFAGKL